MDNAQKQNNQASEADEEFREKLAKMTTQQLERKLEITQAKIERATRSYNRTAARIKEAGRRERTHKLIIAGATLAKIFPQLVELDEKEIAQSVTKLVNIAIKQMHQERSAGSKSPR